uniref:Cupin-like domain-containing protein n=1 Tax=Cyprinus carpio TaxID=7962 RepID=A0A8C2HCB1_CYPCA
MGPYLHFSFIVTGLVPTSPASFIMPSVIGQLCLDIVITLVGFSSAAQPGLVPFVDLLHKNHYGNLYCVISGQKEFILLLPMDRPFIPYGKEHFLYPAVSFLFEIADEEDTTKVPWIPLDLLNPEYDWRDVVPALPVKLLFFVLAVNFWYNMECDIKYNYFQLVESLTNAAEMCMYIFGDLE